MRKVPRLIAVAIAMAFRALEFSFSKLVCFRFRDLGISVRFFPFSSVMSYENISIGSNVFLGHHCTIQSSVASVYIGSHVMFGPYVTIMGGDHEMGEIGRYMSDVKEKRQGSDLDVIINDDVWVGSGATILKGVEIGSGAVVAAGSLVRESVDPYTIVAGVPARKVGSRFTDNELIKHKKIMGIQ